MFIFLPNADVQVFIILADALGANGSGANGKFSDRFFSHIECTNVQTSTANPTFCQVLLVNSTGWINGYLWIHQFSSNENINRNYLHFTLGGNLWVQPRLISIEAHEGGIGVNAKTFE